MFCWYCILLLLKNILPIFTVRAHTHNMCLCMGSPFTHKCTHTHIQLDLILKSDEGGDISDFITNGEWFLIGKYCIFTVKFNIFQSFSIPLPLFPHLCSLTPQHNFVCKYIRFSVFRRHIVGISATCSQFTEMYLLSSRYFAFIWFQFKFWNCIRHTAHIHTYIQKQ